MKVITRLPTTEEFLALRKAAEWPALAPDLAREGLARSLYGCVVQTDTGVVVGMGRIIGDGAIYLHISDVIVHPHYQRQGIGNMIMDNLLAYTDTVGGKHTQIGLMSSKGREPFYKNLGFSERPNDRMGAGMMKVKS